MDNVTRLCELAAGRPPACRAYFVCEEIIMHMTLSQDPLLSPLQHEPGLLVIHLLNRCNLRCQHCYMNASPSAHSHLELDLVLQSVRELERLGVSTVYLSGGEPFLYPALPEVLAALSGQQNVHVGISTNGTLIGAREAAWARECQATVQVSIDGPETYHDWFRGREGAFALSSQGIKHLVSAEVPVAVVMTICQDNLDCLPRMAEWAAEMGVKRISIQPLLQLGRGSAIRDKKLSEAQLCTLFLQLSDLGLRYSSRGLAFSLAYRTRHFLTEHPCAAYVCDGSRCHRKVAKEIKKLIVRENGIVFPEIANLHPRYALGNLSEGSMSELVARYFRNGYTDFQRLCRSVYNEVIPSWKSPIIPWDEIVSEHSWT